VGHYAHHPWNVLPVSSVVQTQFVVAPGTAWVQRRHGGDGVTVVCCGDAGTAEGDFASCLIWSSRPRKELPVLMIVMNNQWGISTPTNTQHSVRHIADRGEAFGIPGETVDGNDPVASWYAIRRAFDWCRRKRSPFLLEAMVSRLHGHSSSSGAIRVQGERDCIELFRQRLIEKSILSREAIDEVWEAARDEADQAVETALKEPQPTAEDVPKHTYSSSPVDSIYPQDYTGLPD
jgi:2-oxoisovalerate dehydrogenase E1 component alpha subunit